MIATAGSTWRPLQNGHIVGRSTFSSNRASHMRITLSPGSSAGVSTERRAKDPHDDVLVRLRLVLRPEAQESELRRTVSIQGESPDPRSGLRSRAHYQRDSRR
jgi:hypothetical protein